MVEAGAPIDAVGLQFHVTAYAFASGRFTEDRIRTAIRRFGELGLGVYVTELDVRVRDLSGPVAGRLDYQRAVYHAIAAACRAEPACRGVTTWGFTDAYSWVDTFYGPDDPLPFGRTKADPDRILAIERDRSTSPEQLMVRLRADLDDLRDLLAEMTKQDWERTVEHSTLGVLDMPRVFEQFLVGHLEAHVRQLQGLLSA